MKTFSANQQGAKPCPPPVLVWQTLLTRLLDQHYGLTLNDKLFSDESVIQEHIDAGITLADAVNFLVEKYELVRIDRKGFNFQEQSPYLRAVYIYGRGRQPACCGEAIILRHAESREPSSRFTFPNLLPLLLIAQYACHLRRAYLLFTDKISCKKKLRF